MYYYYYLSIIVHVYIQVWQGRDSSVEAEYACVLVGSGLVQYSADGSTQLLDHANILFSETNFEYIASARV